MLSKLIQAHAAIQKDIRGQTSEKAMLEIYRHGMTVLQDAIMAADQNVQALEKYVRDLETEIEDLENEHE